MVVIINFRNGANILVTQEELQELQKKWSESLPAADSQGEPFYTLMQFIGEKNSGSVFSYELQLGFDVAMTTLTLFPTLEIAKQCEAVVQNNDPSWRVVGLNREFLDLLLQLVRYQGVKLTISLSPENSVIWSPSKVTALADQIAEKGFHPDMLEVTDAGE
jgi:hypothetical protein